MKTLIIGCLSMVLFLTSCDNKPVKKEASSSASSITAKFDTNSLKHGDVYFQCSMDPEIISDKPGVCSKCGMDLSKMKKN